MTLTTHAIVGASVIQFFPADPWIGFVAAIATHYISDVIPHYNIGDHLGSIKRKETGNRRSLEGFTYDKQFFKDGLVVAFDLLAGVLLALIIWTSAPIPVLIFGIVGGILPDLLQIAYGFWNKNPVLALIHRFHNFMHARKEFDIKSIPLAIVTELAMIGLVAGLAKILI